MIVIRNSELFERVQSEERFGGLFDEGGRLRDREIPVLCGGLDRIVKTKKSVYFYDRGCNGRNNSFVVRRELSV